MKTRRQGEEGKRRRAKPKPMQGALVVVNLAEMGPKPEWEAVQGFFGGLQERERSVILHWLAFHLGSARSEHEADPLAPANYRDHCCGRAAAADRMMMEARALMRKEGDKAGEALRCYFGGRKAAEGKVNDG